MGLSKDRTKSLFEIQFGFSGHMRNKIDDETNQPYSIYCGGSDHANCGLKKHASNVIQNYLTENWGWKGAKVEDSTLEELHVGSYKSGNQKTVTKMGGLLKMKISIPYEKGLETSPYQLDRVFDEYFRTYDHLFHGPGPYGSSQTSHLATFKVKGTTKEKF